ncbi:MAG: hypothetical protein PHH83_02645 [Patescibacteria group bacterium]|nr:hypothetical protein [Patescibacteria group bacterium]
MYKKILIIISILLFISLVIYIAVCDYKNQSNIENDLEEKQQVKKSESENCIAVIEGELSFPSSMIPSASMVCAKNLETNNYYCTPNQVVDEKYRNKKGYRLEVPSGVYVLSGIFSFFKDKTTGLPYEYKYTDKDCNIESCVDVNAPITVNCETISNINLFEYGALNVFEIFYKK